MSAPPPDQPGSLPAERARPGPSRAETAVLTARTVARLRPAQVAHRARLRALGVVEHRWPALTARPSRPARRPGWPVGFEPLDATADHGDPVELGAGRFCFLACTRCLGEPADWHQTGASRLWRFHLHYMEWAWALLQHPERDEARSAFSRLWRSWRAAGAGPPRDMWSPYVASLRLWVLCGVFEGLAACGEVEADVVEQISWHAGYLRTHLELDVGGNHLVKNLKALIGAGVFLGRADLVSAARIRLVDELAVQVLADGGHFERSPSYHAQVLGDLIDVAGLLAAAGEPPLADLEPAIGAMRSWLDAMVGDDGDVALYNDAVPLGSERLAALGPTGGPRARLRVLGPSGYVVLRPDQRSLLVIDVGDPCPPDLPAHAHADCLSVQLWVDGERCVLDTATSTYEPGARRAYERSTAAHSTVEVDGQDQTEVWATFRAARRAAGTLEEVEVHGDTVVVVASHDGYRRLTGAPLHRRRLSASPGALVIEDQLLGAGRHVVVSRLHTPAGPTACTITGAGGQVSEQAATAAWGFGNLRASRCHLLSVETELPVTLSWKLTWT